MGLVLVKYLFEMYRVIEPNLEPKLDKDWFQAKVLS